MSIREAKRNVMYQRRYVRASIAVMVVASALILGCPTIISLAAMSPLADIGGYVAGGVVMALFGALFMAGGYFGWVESSSELDALEEKLDLEFQRETDRILRAA